MKYILASLYSITIVIGSIFVFFNAIMFDNILVSIIIFSALLYITYRSKKNAYIALIIFFILNLISSYFLSYFDGLLSTPTKYSHPLLFACIFAIFGWLFLGKWIVDVTKK